MGQGNHNSFEIHGKAVDFSRAGIKFQVSSLEMSFFLLSVVVLSTNGIHCSYCPALGVITFYPDPPLLSHPGIPELPTSLKFLSDRGEKHLEVLEDVLYL